ncbi:MAG: signal peptide peptidase SppA, partial [Pirellulaceae bacterium]
MSAIPSSVIGRFAAVPCACWLAAAALVAQEPSSAPPGTSPAAVTAAASRATDDPAAKPSSAKSKKATVAAITIKGSLPETAGQTGLLGELETSLSDLVARLDRAAQDKSVSALLLKVRSPSIGPGKVRELREAIQRVRATGKHVTAQLESASAQDYLVACACDEILLPESGEIMIPGVRAELLYYKGLFDLAGIQPEMLQVGDFKGAAEPYTRKEMSPEFRQQYTTVLDDLFQQMIDMIADDRKLEPAKVRELIDVGILLPAEAKSAGLIDDVLYEDEIQMRLADKLRAEKVDVSDAYGKNKKRTDLSGMAGMFELMNMLMGNKTSARSSSNQKLAVVYASGVIMPGESAVGVLGDETVGSDTLIKALRQADEDETVVAIVLRIDSPGGSALASDQIWRAIRQCQKPIVASMGDVAASGGYYIAMGCDKVLAESATITGSIGVVGGKLVLKGLLDKVGLSSDTISRGKHSGILSEMSPFSESERVLWQKLMGEIYRQFLAKTATSRKMPVEELEKLASGRIWTGRQAQQHGLVDQVGTLRDAIAEAKKLAGVDPQTKLEMLMLPKPKSFLDQLLEGDVRAPS